MTIAAVLLAAGAGTRFGGDKLRALLKGRPLIELALEGPIEARFDEVVVVTGASDLDDLIPEDVTILRNEYWSEGQASSLGVGIDWCQRRGHSAAVIGLGDQPGVTAEAWERIATWPEGPIVVATYRRTRGHPVRLDAQVWSLIPTEGDQGARALMSRRPELVVEVACDGTPEDIDTREDLRRWS